MTKARETFHERMGETQGQRRKRFLKFLREIPAPSKRFDDKRKVWLPDDNELVERR